jgi:hypothetical protein
MKLKPSAKNTAAVLRVGAGRGFVIEQRVRLPRRPGLLNHVRRRLVVTAAHCLPHFLAAHAAGYTYDRTFQNLLGKLNTKPSVWAECLFADPIADIGVLGAPDDQALPDKAQAFEDLVNGLEAFEIAEAQSGKGWTLSLDAQWILEDVEMSSGFWGSTLTIGTTQGGMSGSPILNAKGEAIGVVVLGTESETLHGTSANERASRQPILLGDIPGRFIGERLVNRRTRPRRNRAPKSSQRRQKRQR